MKDSETSLSLIKPMLRLNLDSLHKKDLAESTPVKELKSQVNLSLLSKRLGQIINPYCPEFKTKKVHIKLMKQDYIDMKKISVPEIKKMIALRKECRLKFKQPENEEPIDIINMSFIDRSHFWSMQKRNTIETRRNQQASQELEPCSFKPQINTHKKTESVPSSRSKKNLSYIELSQRKLQAKRKSGTSQIRPDKNNKKLGDDAKELSIVLNHPYHR